MLVRPALPSPQCPDPDRKSHTRHRELRQLARGHRPWGWNEPASGDHRSTTTDDDDGGTTSLWRAYFCARLMMSIYLLMCSALLCSASAVDRDGPGLLVALPVHVRSAMSGIRSACSRRKPGGKLSLSRRSTVAVYVASSSQRRHVKNQCNLTYTVSLQ